VTSTPCAPRRGQLLVFWDYDTQWGADRSRSGSGPQQWGHLEFSCTDRLLQLHHDFQVPACFAVVGAAALRGTRPYHDPDQIRRISEAGHEVASHSFRHEWLPGLRTPELRETLARSKQALEDCIGQEVITFVPPYNQPFHYLAKGSISLSETWKGGVWHVGVPRLCAELRSQGYEFCRLSYRPFRTRLREWFKKRRVDEPSRVENIAGVSCVRLNTPGGFGEEATRMLERCAQEQALAVVYGHPHSLVAQNSQNERHLVPFLERVRDLRTAGALDVVLPRDLLRAKAHE
jgi:hypothetical protein